MKDEEIDRVINKDVIRIKLLSIRKKCLLKKIKKIIVLGVIYVIFYIYMLFKLVLKYIKNIYFL